MYFVLLVLEEHDKQDKSNFCDPIRLDNLYGRDGCRGWCGCRTPQHLKGRSYITVINGRFRECFVPILWDGILKASVSQND